MKEEFTINRDSIEDKKVSTALRGLGRVEVPADFDMRVRARIASRKADKRAIGGRLFPWLAIPAGFTALCLAAFVIYFSSAGSNELAGIENLPSQSTLNENIPQQTAQNDALPSIVNTDSGQTSEATSFAATTNDLPMRTANNVSRNISEQNIRKVTPIPNAANDRPGSVDMLLRGPEKVVNIDEMRSAVPVVKVTATDILVKVGINAEVKGGFWQVNSVIPDSLAARKGVITGDRIESVDGRKPETSPVFASGHSIKSVVIRREDGSFHVLDLK